MTLRESVNEEEIKNANDEKLKNKLKLQAFSDMLKETAKYLILHHNGYRERRDENSPRDASKELIAKYGFYIGAIVTVVGYKQLDNIYVKKFYDTLVLGPTDDDFSGIRTHHDSVYSNWDVDYSCTEDLIEDLENECFEYDYCEYIEDMIHSGNENYSSAYASIDVSYTRSYSVYLSNDTMKLNVIFWNLFLCALDDDIYNKQLSLVVELAHCFKLDEHIMGDICRAVEYVLSGKKLSEDCDLYCETVECAKFFLGHE